MKTPAILVVCAALLGACSHGDEGPPARDPSVETGATKERDDYLVEMRARVVQVDDLIARLEQRRAENTALVTDDQMRDIRSMRLTVERARGEVDSADMAHFQGAKRNFESVYTELWGSVEKLLAMP